MASVGHTELNASDIRAEVTAWQAVKTIGKGSKSTACLKHINVVEVQDATLSIAAKQNDSADCDSRHDEPGNEETAVNDDTRGGYHEPIGEFNCQLQTAESVEFRSRCIVYYETAKGL